MKFEDTKLPDHTATRIAFKKAQMQATLFQMSNPQLEDKGVGPASLKLFVRAGEIMHETVPATDPEQIAGAVLFLNTGFQEPSLMHRAHRNDLPGVCAWAQEWRDVNIGNKRLEDASLALRQIVAAVSAAMIEGFRDNLPSLNAEGVRNDLMEKDLVAQQVGDLQVPALQEKFRRARSEIEQALAQQPKSAPFLRRFRRLIPARDRTMHSPPTAAGSRSHHYRA